MTDPVVTISLDKYEAAVRTALRGGWGHALLDQVLAAAGVEVERTAEKRIAAFVRALEASHGPDMPGLPELIRQHFPEAEL